MPKQKKAKTGIPPDAEIINLVSDDEDDDADNGVRRSRETKSIIRTDSVDVCTPYS